MENNPKKVTPKIVDIRNTSKKVDTGIQQSVDTTSIESAVREENSAIVRKYNEKYNHALNAPIPPRKVPFSYILTTAVPPKMKEYSDSGLIITNKLDIDPRDLQAMKIFSVNVADEQQILLQGRLVEEQDMKPGDVVKINFSRYKALADNHEPGLATTVYNIPQVTINGFPYLLLDSRDVMLVTPSEEINKQQ